MPYNCVVLIKQVPDTKAVTGNAMNDDGTVNRAALPAIVNPEDLNALEMALQIKQRFGGDVTALTMGLPKACDVLRQALYRGADHAVLVTDRRCAASDTLATSYILACAVRRLGNCDLILCGRQAIDGDTAQVGPQLAEKLGVPQLTYVEALQDIADGAVTVRRNIGTGWENVACPLPVLMTVVDTANQPRPAGARRIMKFKKARSAAELIAEGASEEEIGQYREKGLLIQQWDLDHLEADLTWCGRSGSPTKVHRIQSVVLTATGHQRVEPNDEGLKTMVRELIDDHTIG